MRKLIAAVAVAAICVAAASPSWAATNITENVTLTEDTDWREHGHVTIASGVTVALNGYKLKVKGLTCNGSIIGIEGYRQLTYIQASREQWIDTGFVPTATTALDVDFTTTDCNDNRAYFGAGWAKDYMLLVNTGYFRFWADGGNLLAFTANKHYRFATLPDETPNVVMYDGETGALLGSATKSLANNKGYTMLIFACHQDNGTSGFQPSRYRLHSFQMTDNGTVVRDLVPVVRTSDGAAGLWDRKNFQFYGNVGSGTFIQGPDLATLILDLSDGATYSVNGTCDVPMAVGDSTLSQDCDLRALGNVEIAGEVALNGHKLYTAGVVGYGTVLNQFGMYSHYRFKVEDIGNPSSKCLAFTELCLYSYGVNVNSQRSGSSASLGGGSNAETWEHALDGIIGIYRATPFQDYQTVANNKWCVTYIKNFDTLWMQIDFAEPIMISKYEWYSTSDGLQQDRAPTKWRFQGSDDGTNWVDLDVVERAYEDNPSTSGTLAYTRDLTPAPSVLQVDVANGLTKTNSTLALSGYLKVEKTGTGTFVASKAGQASFGGTEVVEGTLKPGVNSAGVFGKGGDTLAVADGAQILDNLAANNAFALHYLQLAGEGPDGTGAYRVTGSKPYTYNYAWTRGLTVTNDTLFGRDDYGFGLVSMTSVALPLTLNGKTLIFKSSKGTGQSDLHLPFRNVQGNGPGTLVISDYVRLYPKNATSTLPEVTLVIDTLGRYLSASDESSITVSNLVYRSSFQSPNNVHAVTVLGSYTPESTVSTPKVQLGDETHLSPTLDLSGWAGTFNKAFGGGLTFAEGATVSVKVGSRKIPRRVIGWTEGTGPANVNFVLADAVGRLTVESDGVYRQTGFMIIVK